MSRAPAAGGARRPESRNPLSINLIISVQHNSFVECSFDQAHKKLHNNSIIRHGTFKIVYLAVVSGVGGPTSAGLFKTPEILCVYRVG